MQDILKGFYPRFTLHSDPLINSAANVLIILLLGLISWWILSFAVSRFKKRKEDSSFLKANNNIFVIIKKAGHSVIFLMVGVGLINFINIPLIEKIFYALMILLIASFANSLAKDLIPYLEQKLVAKTSTKIDDVIFDLLKRFSTVIIYVTAIILALDVVRVNIVPFVAGAGVAGPAFGLSSE